ncbi:helix-turn-helix transcriptional regulator [Rhodoferax sediminis]|uniref:AlpA family phage regulatory protein n=1 Tax=Rhodoferax sediminis TaxID=2509614 RepID=A0A515DE68_9BURK|nr:AlpA family phage regulatory protein [Rhodoferax sediminis]QDL38712.1 AlpA family phage regulatory protein [Rhodoferax sediminis]
MQKQILSSTASAVTSSISSTVPVLPETGFLRQPQVLIFVPISKSTLWRRIQAKSFPEPVKLSARVTVWRAEDVRRWIAEQGGGLAGASKHL